MRKALPSSISLLVAFLATLAILNVAIAGLVLTQSPDLVSVILRESAKPVQCVGVRNLAELAPESQVINVELSDVPKLTNSAPELPIVAKPPKQSQEFDSDSSTAANNNAGSSTAPVEIQETTQQSSAGGQNISSTESSVISSSSSTTSTITTSTKAPIPSGSEPGEQPFVPSNITRQGAKVFCGEANPDGRSNDRLIPSRIVGGQKTKPGEFPFQVRLNIRSRRGSGICGGVIVDERHILTAAHCMTACVSQHLNTVTIETTGVHATIGDHSIKSNDGETEVEIEKIIPHEKYDACNFYANDHDIALIKTTTPMEYKFTIDGYGSVNRPCLPKAASELAADTYREGDPVYVSGWGVTRENSGSLSNILRYVQVNIVNLTKCQDVYGTRVTNEHICAGHQLGGKDSCQGDSGGPLVRLVDNRFELVGIVSFGYGCGQPGAPGVYTRVASYIDWMKANL